MDEHNVEREADRNVAKVMGEGKYRISSTDPRPALTLAEIITVAVLIALIDALAKAGG